jgi:hypothetical protein
LSTRGVLVAIGLSGLALSYSACSTFDATDDATPDGAVGPDTSAAAPDGGIEAAPLDSGLRPGLSDCGAATPVDLENDPLNCKVCGQACEPGTTCVAGQCTPMTGLVACAFDAGGRKVCEPNDPRHCAATGGACAMNQICTGTDCLFTATVDVTDACAPPLKRCAEGNVDQALKGCYATTTALNCGGCGNTCNPGTECVDGACVPVSPSLIATTVCVAGSCPAGATCCGNPSKSGTQVFCVGGSKCP